MAPPIWRWMDNQWRCFFWLFFVFQWCIWFRRHELLTHAPAHINNGMHAYRRCRWIYLHLIVFQERQSPIIFGRVWPQITIFVDSDEDLEPSHFFHYARIAHRMTKEMGYNLHRGKACILIKDDAFLCNLLCLKESQPTITIQHTWGWGMSLHIHSLNQRPKSLPSHSSDLSEWESDVSVGVVLKKKFANMTSISYVKHDEDVEPFDTDL